MGLALKYEAPTGAYHHWSLCFFLLFSLLQCECECEPTAACIPSQCWICMKEKRSSGIKYYVVVDARARWRSSGRLALLPTDQPMLPLRSRVHLDEGCCVQLQFTAEKSETRGIHLSFLLLFAGFIPFLEKSRLLVASFFTTLYIGCQ